MIGFVAGGRRPPARPSFKAKAKAPPTMFFCVRTFQTAPSGTNTGVWCLVRMKKVHINVGNNNFFTKIVPLKSGLKSDILLIEELSELEGQDRQCSQLVGMGEWRGVLLFKWGVDSRLL